MQFFTNMVEESEWQTRKTRIDVLLKEQGWRLDGLIVIEEVDTKQSNFKVRDYKTKKDTWGNKKESQFVDYLLLDKQNNPIAVIEAKKFSRDPIVGQKQAQDYADDVQKQTGKPVFIFLTNGVEVWFWNRAEGVPKQIRAFYSQDDLEKVRFLNENRKPLSVMKIRKDIIDRPYQIEAVKRILEGLEQGRRKFLLVMATGTGKTRTAVALIDVLLNARWVKKVLFLTDRRALRDQALNKGFKKFLPEEARSTVFSGEIDKSARLYVSTLQTLISCYQSISPGYFDLIISDESHRSIFNKFKEIFTYFDAVQVGLTATPADLVDRDTFRFFECEFGVPTFLYEYWKAVEEGHLIPFEVYNAQTHFQVKGITSEDVPASERKRLLEEGLTLDDLNWDGSKIEKEVAPVGTNEALVREFMAEAEYDETGTLPGKTIIFALTHVHAKRIWEAFNKLYPQYKGKLAQIIDYQIERRDELLKEFEYEKWPRIAITVDMLSTGVDVEPIQNLVFAKPIFSKIRFWQMIGRGTRKCSPDCGSSNILCKQMNKEYFKILDFWGNFKRFKLEPEGRESKASEALPVKIFKFRLNLLELFEKKGMKEEVEIIRSEIFKEIKSLPMDSVSVREHIEDIEKALHKDFWSQVGLNHFDFLMKKISPLMKFKTDVNYDVYSFILKTEQLKLAVLEKDKKKLERLQERIGFDLQCLPVTLKKVKDKETFLNKAKRKDFWEKISVSDAFKLQEEFAELMKLKRKNPREPIVIDMDDVVEIESREKIEFGPEGKEIYVKEYKDLVEKRIKELAETHPTIKKIKNNELLNEKDLVKLEEILNSPELYITEEVLQKAYRQSNGALVEFIKNVLGLYEFPDPEKRIAEAFRKFMVEKQIELNSNKLLFMRTLQTVFAKKDHIEYSDLFAEPFTNIGKAPKPLFNDSELKEIVALCNGLEKAVKSK